MVATWCLARVKALHLTSNNWVNIIMNKLKEKLLLLLFIFSPSVAIGAFPGDVYFDVPSVTVEQQSTTELGIDSFVGTESLGAVHLEIDYDSSMIKIVEVSLGSSNELQDSFFYKDSIGKLSILTANNKSLEKPIGTVSIAKIRIKPIGDPGSRTLLNITVKDMLQGNSDLFNSFNGFSGEINISQPANNRSIRITPSLSKINLIDRAEKLRPLGSKVILMEADNSTSEVMLIDSNTPSEAGDSN